MRLAASWAGAVPARQPAGPFDCAPGRLAAVRLSQPVFQFQAAVGLLVAVFDDHGRV
jgi:hypothetical protein